MAHTFIVRDFSLSRDFRNIAWKETLWYNTLRAAAAGLVIGILMFLIEETKGGVHPLLSPFIWPIGYLIIMLPVGLASAWLARFSGWVALFAGFIALFAVTLGDPIVCILYRSVPRLVPVENPPLFSFSIVMLVLKSTSTTEISIARH